MFAHTVIRRSRHARAAWTLADTMRRVERRTARPVTLGLVLVCLGGTLLIGAIQKSPCAGGNWADGRQYHLACYTDIVPLFATEQLAGGRLPYLDACVPSDHNCDEYPVLTMYLMRTAGWISGDDPGRFFWVNAILLAVCAAVAAACLYQIDPRRSLWFALAPSLALQAFVNWDLFAVALTTAGMLAFFRRRDGWAGALVGLGTAAKLFPGLLLVPFAADRLRGRQPDRAILLWWSAAAAWLAVNVPFAVAGLAGWWEFFRFNGARGADWDSLWFLACRHLSACASTGLINVGIGGAAPDRVRVGLAGQAPPGARLPSMAARVPVPRPVPAPREGVLTPVQPLAAPVAGAWSSPAPGDSSPSRRPTSPSSSHGSRSSATTRGSGACRSGCSRPPW